jgi:hypothetical protein
MSHWGVIMDTISTNLATTGIPAEIPTGVRAFLWTAVVAAVIVALVMGVMLIAGNNHSKTPLWKPFLLTFLVVLAAQAGYIAAPFAIGRAGWAWAFWLMVPLAVLVLATTMTPIIGAIKWTRPDGASGWKTIASMGWISLIGVAVYVAPPVLVWVYRPASAGLAAGTTDSQDAADRSPPAVEQVNAQASGEDGH